MKKSTVPAILFAGGMSSRMGRDKALLPFGESDSLAHYQYRRLCRCFNTVYLSAKEAKFDFDAPLITDRYPEHSPLVGIISVLEALPHKNVFVLSVDTPFVNRKIIHTLLSQPVSADAVIAANYGRLQPLCGIYTQNILPAAKRALSQGSHKLGMLLQGVNLHTVSFEEETAFMNLNHPSDYEEARRIILSSEGSFSHSPASAS